MSMVICVANSSVIFTLLYPLHLPSPPTLTWSPFNMIYFCFSEMVSHFFSN
jgi:hypothetical protein